MNPVEERVIEIQDAKYFIIQGLNPLFIRLHIQFLALAVTLRHLFHLLPYSIPATSSAIEAVQEIVRTWLSRVQRTI